VIKTYDAPSAENPDFRLTPKQVEAQHLIATPGISDILLYGGARSAKTFLICRTIAIRAMKSPFSRHAIMRYRFNHVKQSIILDTWPKMMRLCFPGVKCHIDKSDWYAQFPNGAQVWFGGLDEGERLEKLLGMEYVTIFLNECSQISLQARETMITRLAQKVYQEVEGKGLRLLVPKMFYDENPPSKGHWSYKMFIQKMKADKRETLAHPERYAVMQMNPKDNLANLSPDFMEKLDAMTARMRLRFRDGVFSEIVENQLFDDVKIETYRVVNDIDVPDMVRIVVAVDPSGSGDEENAKNDEIGIVVAGLGIDGLGYLLADCTVKAGPATWGKVATDSFERFEANTIVAEQNFGGAMVERVIQVTRPRTPYKAVTASRGKQVRAEPIAALVELGKIRHVGYYPLLEDELVQFTTNGYQGPNSPNRADAYVWAFTELFGAIVKKVKKNQAVMPPRVPLDRGVGY